VSAVAGGLSVVQRQPKDDPVYPPAEFLRFTQRPKLLVSAQERFLCNIFGVGGIARMLYAI